MAVIEISRIQVRRGQENQTGIPTLAGGEFGWAADTEHLYIGLRRDDGGARDANVRILTENDLFQVVTTTDLAYTYRSDTNPSITSPTFNGIPFERPINEKNDDEVSIKDFGVEGVGGDEVASALIQVAVDNLFLDPLKTDSNYGKSSAKILKFPAGTYNIDTAIFIPRYTTIIGEGSNKTIINLISTSSHAFQTIDSDPDNAYPGRVTFDQYGISSGISQPNDIHIEGLTIQYSTTTDVSQCLSLVSLDCSENAIFRDVKFLGNHVPTDNTTSTYVGIHLRGYAGRTASSDNVLIDHCEFSGLYHDVLSNHDILYPTIQNTRFSNSVRGVTFSDPKDNAANYGPRYGRITNNVFDGIEQEGIYVGLSPNVQHHISSFNKFYNVGNGGGDESTPAYAVIKFVRSSNSSVDDWFDRQEYQNINITNPSLQYYPLVEGYHAIETPIITTVSLNDGDVNRAVLKFPTSSAGQQLIVKYNLFDGIYDPVTKLPIFNVDRMGTMKLSLQNGNIVDDYSYNIGAAELVWHCSYNGASRNYVISVDYISPNALGATLEMQSIIMV